ncbi:fibronectin type III domain-containing protein [Robertkochia sediminum]|uniref:hypothetical protein n=1 Tax=Robertkochia sediminum TaxID=2785326 RepID=UPI00193151C2|nr:hypothetical protein [Robertkochia sediminum]MBL7471355.1 hypothetical protein [Robertkochia sediminum]
MMVRTTLIFCFAALLWACSKGGDDEGVSIDTTPAAAQLLLPEDGAPCEPGAIIDNSFCEVDFEWKSAKNAETYTLYLTDELSRDAYSFNTTDTRMTLTLKRGTPYRWYVETSNKEHLSTPKSAVWVFYTQGKQVSNYAPFPATLVFPEMGQVVDGPSLTLQWEGRDVETPTADLNYEVFLGLDASEQPRLIATKEQEAVVNNLVQDTVYYWKVRTQDANNQFSETVLHQFRVN